MQKLIAIVALALVAGCSTSAQQDAQSNACWQRMMTQSAEWQELSAYMPPPGGSASMTLLTNKETPTPEQAAALIRLHNDYRRICQDARIASLRASSPVLAGLTAGTVAALNQGYAKLASREATWGAYAQFQAQVLAEHNRQWAAISQAQHNAEVQQHQAAFANAYSIYATQTMLQQNQRAINAANRPRSTNCQVIGGFLQCTTF